MLTIKQLENILHSYLDDVKTESAFGELTLFVEKSDIIRVANVLKSNKSLLFQQLTDLCGVDYLHYGIGEWDVDDPTSVGYSRARTKMQDKTSSCSQRFAVIYHVLSLVHNVRLRIKVMLDDTDLSLPSVNAIWASANWYERECFDLFGIFFTGHPDLRRILTDYGFDGHPFRKDFPLEGKVELHYDGAQQKCVYGDVEIKPRVVIPKVVRYPKYNNQINKSGE